jgi:hypothetical protein
MRVAMFVLLAGCVDTEQLPAMPTLDAAHQFSERAWPALSVCAGCHGSQPTIDFLAPGTADGAYATVFAFQPAIIDLGSPSASLLVTMGKHTGPALDPTSAQTVLDWLDQERKERVTPTGSAIEVGPVSLVLGTPASLALPTGGTIAFTPSTIANGLYLSQLAITAPAAGLHVVHPLFVEHPARLPAIIDTLDRFSDVDVRLGPNETYELGGGDALFLDFDPSVPLAVHFHTLEAP